MGLTIHALRAWSKQILSDFKAFFPADFEDADGSEERMLNVITLIGLSARLEGLREKLEKYQRRVASRRCSANIERGRKLGRWRQGAREHYKRPRGRWARGLRRSQGASVKAPNMNLDR